MIGSYFSAGEKTYIVIDSTQDYVTLLDCNTNKPVVFDKIKLIESAHKGSVRRALEKL